MAEADLNYPIPEPLTDIEQAAIQTTLAAIERSVFHEGDYFFLDEVWGDFPLSDDAHRRAVGRVRSEVKKSILGDRFGLPTREVLDPYRGAQVIGRRVDETDAISMIQSGKLPNAHFRKVASSDGYGFENCWIIPESDGRRFEVEEAYSSDGKYILTRLYSGTVDRRRSQVLVEILPPESLV